MPDQPATRMLTRTPGAAAAQASFLALSRVEAVRVGGWDRHRHAEHEVIIAFRGDYRGSINGEPVHLQPGEALVVQPGDWHEDRVRAGTCYQALWFRQPGGLLAPGTTAAQRISRPGPGLLAAIRQLESQAEAGAPPGRLDATLAAVIGLLADGLPPAALGPAFARDEGFAARLHAQFARLPPGRASAATIARAMASSRRSLERHCRDVLACGPVQAHARWRIQRAGELLRTTDWPVRAVSEAMGFANPFHFSRAFVRVHGAPPAVWRRGGNG